MNSKLQVKSELQDIHSQLRVTVRIASCCTIIASYTIVRHELLIVSYGVKIAQYKL